MLPKGVAKKMENAILISYAGSKAHGTSTEESDIDVVGIVIPGIDCYFGTKTFTTQSGKEGNIDYVIHEFRKFLGLLKKGNPSSFEILWMPDRNLLHSTSQGDLLRKKRDLFLSKNVYQQFVGYARSQFHKMNIGDLGSCGEKRKKIRQEFGIDVKNASHLIRILAVGTVFLKTQEFVVDQDASLILEIKQGKWNVEKINKKAEELFQEMEAALKISKLPDEPNHEEINKLSVEILESWFADGGSRTTHRSGSVNK